MPYSSFLPPITKERLEAMWLRYTVIEIARKTGLTSNVIYFWGRKYGLPRRARKKESRGPSQEVISQRAAEIRSKWSDEEAERRWCGPKRREWTMPMWSSVS